jgi:hypothetical protein
VTKHILLVDDEPPFHHLVEYEFITNFGKPNNVRQAQTDCLPIRISAV